MWHVSVSMGPDDGPRPVSSLTRAQLRELETAAWDLVGRYGRPEMTRWELGDSGNVVHLRRALTDIELVAVNAINPEFLVEPAVHLAGGTSAYRPLTGLGLR